MATECRVFGDNGALEFCGISQTVPQNLAKFAVEKRKTETLTIYDVCCTAQLSE